MSAKISVQDDKLIDLLKAPLGLTDSAVMSSLPGGAINRAHYLNDDTNEYMVKEFQGESALCIDRQERFNLQLILSNNGLAPKPIYLSPNGGIYVEEWVKQHRSQMLLIFDERHINLLAKALTRVHTSKVETKALDLPADWLKYLTAMPSLSKRLIKEVTEHTEKWIISTNSNPDEQVFCHNDLVWAHLCVPTNIILDWEYAGIGNRYFDVLSCAKVNSFNTKQRDLLLAAYAKQNNIPVNEVIEGCSQQADFLELTYQLWHQAVGITSKN